MPNDSKLYSVLQKLYQVGSQNFQKTKQNLNLTFNGDQQLSSGISRWSGSSSTDGSLSSLYAKTNNLLEDISQWGTQPADPESLANPKTLTFNKPPFDGYLFLEIQACSNPAFLEDQVQILLDSKTNVQDRSKLMAFNGLTFATYSNGLPSLVDNQTIVVTLQNLENGTYLRYRWLTSDPSQTSDWFGFYYPAFNASNQTGLAQRVLRLQNRVEQLQS